MSLLTMSFSASVFILAIVIIRTLLLHKLPKRTFIVLWGVVLCRLLIPYDVSSRFSVYSIAHTLTSRFSGTDVSLNGASVTPHPTGITATAATLPAASSAPVPLFMVIWLIGSIACALFFLVTHLRCRREYKTALPVNHAFVKRWQQEHPLRRKVRILQSDRIFSPLTYGIFRPVVLLPKHMDWTDEARLRYILTHEFVHIRRWDTLTKLVMAAALCIHWFNPLVWLMYVLSNRDMELSCDEAVVRTCVGDVRSEYALTLLGLGERKSRFMPLVNNFNKNAIEERIVSIMKMTKTSLVGAIAALLLVTGTVIVFATNAPSVTATNTPVTDETRGIEMSGTDFPENKANGSALTDSASTGEASKGPDALSSEDTMTANEIEQLYAVYAPFGLTYDKEKDNFYYNGKLVRTFVDILSSNGEAMDSGKFQGSINQWISSDDKGEIDVKAVRDYNKPNGNGEGELIGIEIVK
ncbi:M56 family metallopeptidase [Paenibacillus sp. 598K]|uniref:M56 family metallopeptidase n=1 Tax=Paenibacillus sp. 598K TaxID=1117987 RepID=UPI001625B062|nr:M56 family metallopeptidase [Paenibacillus sp. 598K]